MSDYFIKYDFAKYVKEEQTNVADTANFGVLGACRFYIPNISQVYIEVFKGAEDPITLTLRLQNSDLSVYLRDEVELLFILRQLSARLGKKLKLEYLYGIYNPEIYDYVEEI